MGALLLNSKSVMICPHGGIVMHTPTTYSSYRVDGRLPLFFTDVFMIVGCPHFTYAPSPCHRVVWLNPTVNLLVKGIPLLTLNSVGLCQTAAGVPQGPVTIAYTQTGQREPDTFTHVKQ